MELEIRVAALQDAGVVSEILMEAADWVRKLRQPLWTPDQVAVEKIAPECEAGSFFLAWSGTTALGTMRITDFDPLFWPEATAGEAIYLHRLAVRRAVAGGLVASVLLRHAAEMSTARGAAFLRLDCEENRPRLRQVYERFGFEFHSNHSVRGVDVARYQLASSIPPN